MNKDIGAEMNEKIRELMLAAGYAAPDLASRGQKLAELIVKECCDLFTDPNEPYSGTYIHLKIKQHFGVEE